MNTFGQYGGKVLEKTTHKESPWLLARSGFGENVPSNEIISKGTIKEYFHELINEYDISKEENINKYILNLSNII